MLRSLSTMGLFQLFAMMVSFARNIVLARLLSQQEMGIASVLMLVVTTLDLIASAGLQQYVVQRKETLHSDPALATCHSFGLVRGIAFALLLVALSSWLASLLGVPHAATALALLAVVPLARALIHLDAYCQQQAFKFNAINLIELSGNVTGLIVATSVALTTGDHRAAVAAILAQTCMSVFASHWMSTRRYRLGMVRSELHALVRFSLPLMLNGLLLATTINGDRTALALTHPLGVKNPISLEEIAVYSLAFNLIFTPIMLIMRVATTAMLPVFVRNKTSTKDRLRKIALFSQAICLFAGLSTIAFAILGNGCMTLFYGKEYKISQWIFTLLAITLTCRTVRTIPTTIALAEGDSLNTLAANMVRALAFPACIGVLLLGYRIEAVVLATASFEFLAFATSSFLVSTKHEITLAGCWIPMIFIYGMCISVALVSVYAMHSLAIPALLFLAALVVVTALTTFRVSMELRAFATQLLRRQLQGVVLVQRKL